MNEAKAAKYIRRAISVRYGPFTLVTKRARTLPVELWQWIKEMKTLQVDNSLKTPGWEGEKSGNTCEEHKISRVFFFLDERSLDMFKYSGRKIHREEVSLETSRLGEQQESKE